jgi:PhnB protein
LRSPPDGGTVEHAFAHDRTEPSSPCDPEVNPVAVDPIPSNYPRVIPALSIDGASAAIEFYCSVLGAELRFRLDMPGGKVGHAELTIGDSMVMLADEFPDMGFVGPRTVGGTPVSLMVYVTDADAVFAAAIAAGATELSAPEDHFYGDRSGQFEDPWGHRWTVASHVEDISAEEMERRAAQAAAEM